MSVNGLSPSNDEERKPLLGIHRNDRGDIPQHTGHTGFGTRHVFTAMLFFGFVNVYAMRVNLSVALVAMVNSTAIQKNDSDVGQCPDPGVNKTGSRLTDGQYAWDEVTQGFILSSFFYGYIITQVPGGWLAERFGGKKLFGFGVLTTAVFTLLTPLAAKLGVEAIIAVRVIEGIGEGVTFPASHAMLGKWAPKMERTTMVALVVTGSAMGSMLAFPISGILCSSTFLGGWPAVFYVFGGLTVIWFVMWMILVYDTPAQHPRISVVERRYIEASVGERIHYPTPWRAIFTSVPVWAVCVAYFAGAWGLYSMLTAVPTYMARVQKFDITQDGLMMALPQMAGFIIMMFVGKMADFLRTRYISTTVTRKIFTSVAMFAPAIVLIFIQTAKCDHTMLMALLIMTSGFASFMTAGTTVNHLDIAHNFAGTLMGITNSFGTLAGILSPYTAGLVTNGKQTMAQWQIVFYISTGMYAVGGVAYLLLGSGEEQPWNTPTTDFKINENTDVKPENS